MATKKAKDSDASLPFAALQLLAPPVRLVSAALWKAMKQRDVMQYGVVEEFVTSACETVPGLLTARHQAKLALGLRGRLVLELCRTQPDEQIVMPHLERIRAPSALSISSAHAVKRDVKIVRTVECFHSMVHSLLMDPAERELFFREEFPVDYSPAYEDELEKLLWEFLIRLDQLLPAPDLAQTVSWLSDTPAVLEECARAATQPQLLKVLLQHQTCLGHLETAASLPPNMGDSILASLSLEPSGRVSSRRPATSEPPDSAEPRDKSAFITPVIGLISNDDVPVLAGKKRQRLADEDVTEPREPRNDSEGGEASKRRGPAKRQQPECSESDAEEEGEGETIPSGKRWMKTSEAAGGGGGGDGTQSGLCLPDDPALCSVFMSCLNNQPRVVVEKVSTGSFYGGPSRGSAKLQARAPTHKRRSERAQKADSDYPGLNDKENRPVPSCSPTLQRHNSETSAPPGGGEDYVADSEDEATKNFKGRLFMKRYYKTKHGTFIPTLREFWRPGMTWRDRSSPGNKRRR